MSDALPMAGELFAQTLPAGPGSPLLEREEAEVKRWLSQIQRVLTMDRKQFKEFGNWERALAGDAIDTGVLAMQSTPDRAAATGAEESLSESNLVFANYATVISHIDTDTDVTIAPSRAVDDLHYALATGFATTAEIMLRRRGMRDPDYDERKTELMRSTFAACIGWLKVAYARDYKTEPVLKMRPEDAQDELARMEQLAQQMGDETDADKRYQLGQELKSLRDALFQQVQVMQKEGVVIDRVQASDMVVSPEVGDILVGWQQAEWIAQGCWMTPAEVATRFDLTETERRMVRTHAQGVKDGDVVYEGETHDGSAERADLFSYGMGVTEERGYARVWEIWDRRSMRVLTAVDGLKRWARPPMQPPRQPSGWFPYFPIGYNHIPGRRYPVGDVKLLMPFQEEYTEVRERYMAHRRATVPRTGMDASVIDRDEADKFNRAPAGALVPLERRDGDLPLEQAFFVAKYAPVDPRLYETQSIIAGMERQAGLGDANLGAVSRAKTATEAAQVAQGARGRLGERTKALRRMERKMFPYILEMLLLEVPLEQVQRVAGMMAVWPPMDRNAVDDLVSIEISHTTESDKEIKRMGWSELAPQLQAMVMQIAQLRMSQLDWIAAPLIEIMRESFRRAGETLSVEKFLPGGPISADQPIPDPLADAAAMVVSPITQQQLAIVSMIAGNTGPMAPGQGLGAGQPQPGPGGPQSGGPPGQGGEAPPPGVSPQATGGLI